MTDDGDDGTLQVILTTPTIIPQPHAITRGLTLKAAASCLHNNS